MAEKDELIGQKNRKLAQAQQRIQEMEQQVCVHNCSSSISYHPCTLTLCVMGINNGVSNCIGG